MEQGRDGAPPSDSASDPAFLQAVLEAVPAFVIRLDPEERIRYINRLQTGFTLENVVGRSAYDFIDPEHHALHRHAIAQALSTGKPWGFMSKGAGPNGERAYYDCRSVPVDNGDGRLAVCIIASEVTEHVARGDALQASEERLRIAVDATGIGLWSWDAATNRSEGSARLEEIMGCQPPTPRRYVETLVHPDDRETLRAEVGAMLRGEPPFSLTPHRIVRPSGELRWVMVWGRMVRDDAGKLVRMTGGVIDVTSQRLVEERLREAQKIDLAGGLTAGVAHNFNNMLAVIVPALDLALASEAGPHQRLLEDARHAARRAAELVAQLMTFAGQRRAVAPKLEDLGEIVARAVSMCRRTFDSRLAIEQAIASGPWLTVCDGAAIEQVVVNLLINARDAVAAAERVDPRITVTVSTAKAPPSLAAAGAAEHFLRISVEDNGIGVSDAVKQRLFEPFFTTKQPGQGTGLGLATSYGIVRDHRGLIALQSEQGVGTRADVWLPVAKDENREAWQTRPITPSPKHGKVLVVDDEPAICRVVELLLSERGHKVSVACDGRAAVNALDAGELPDLILLDRSMPGWPVKLTLEKIRARLPRVPVVFFTGQDVPVEERALVQDVLYKPLSTEELVDSVEAWLPRA